MLHWRLHGGTGTDVLPFALPTVDTAVRNPVVSGFRARHPIFPDFPDNRRSSFLQPIRDFPEVTAFVQRVFELETLFDGQVRHDSSFLIWGLSY